MISVNSDADLACTRRLRLVKGSKSPIVLSLLVGAQAAVMLALLTMYLVAPAGVPVPLIFLVTMTALLVSAAVLVSLPR